MATKPDTADPDLELLLRGASDATRLLALKRLADSGRPGLKALLEPIAQKDKSLTVRYLAQRVLRALGGAPPGFGDADPEPGNLQASGLRQRPTALVAALRDPLATPVAGTRIPKLELPAPSLEEEPTSPIPVQRGPRAERDAANPIPRDTVPAPAPRVDPEIVRLERAALDVLKPCVRQLSHLLQNGDPELAAECALALGRLRAHEAYDLVAGRARLSPPDERYIKSLGEIGDPRAAEMLSRFWGDTRWQGLRPAIGVAACRIRSSRAEEFLRNALAEDDLAVQGAVIRHLSATADTRFVEVLLAKLGKVQEFFEVLVIQALARFAPTQPQVVSALLERLPREPNPRTASCIISSLAGSGHPELADSLEKLTRQRDRRVRANAVDAVMRLEVPPHVKTKILRPLLDDDDNRVRANAARLMTQLGDRGALDVLRAMLAHKDKWWRASACHALGECRPPGTAALLGKALKDPELDVRLNATRALKDVDDPAVPQLLLGLLTDKNLYIRVHAMEALGNLRVKAAASALRAAIRAETSPQGIAAALAAVARTCPVDVAVKEIAPLLTHATASVRLATVEALLPVLDTETVNALKPALKDGDRRVRAAAVRAFFACGQLKVVSSLYDALLSEDRGEQIAVSHALGELAGVVFSWRDAPPPDRLLSALKKLPAYAPEGRPA